MEVTLADLDYVPGLQVVAQSQNTMGSSELRAGLVTGSGLLVAALARDSP